MKNRFLTILLAAAAVLSLPGCERLMEGAGDCKPVYKVRFTFTMNILGTDAFASKVGSVSLFVFDRQGRFVTMQSEAGEALSEPGYLMTLDVPAGTYDLIAWCGLAGNPDFALDNATTPQSKEDLVCRLLSATAPAPVSDKALAPVWHGMAASVECPEEGDGDRIVATIDLTKDVNTVRVTLQHYTGRELDPEDFEFSIADDNGFMDWDNSLLPCEKIGYSQWTRRPGTVSMPGGDAFSADITSISSVTAELDVARLVKEGQAPVLTVRQDGAEKPLLRLPLIDLLLLAKGEARIEMDDQEYLDRQDEYNFIFFLDEADGWYRLYAKGGIWVNSWHLDEFHVDI